MFLLARKLNFIGALRIQFSRVFSPTNPLKLAPFGLGLSIELPLLNQNQGPIAEAEARRREQAANFNSLQARVLGEIEIALAGYDTARAQLESSATVLEELDKQEWLTRAMFEVGEVSRQAVAAARVERTDATLSRLDARFKAQEALGRLESALQRPSEFATPFDSPSLQTKTP